MTRVIVHIDRLVLRGVARGAERAVAEALRSALARQLAHATAQALSGWHATPRIDAGTVRVGATTTPERVGAAAGRAIAGRLVPR